CPTGSVGPRHVRLGLDPSRQVKTNSAIRESLSVVALGTTTPKPPTSSISSPQLRVATPKPSSPRLLRRSSPPLLGTAGPDSSTGLPTHGQRTPFSVSIPAWGQRKLSRKCSAPFAQGRDAGRAVRRAMRG